MKLDHKNNENRINAIVTLAKYLALLDIMKIFGTTDNVANRSARPASYETFGDGGFNG